VEHNQLTESRFTKMARTMVMMTQKSQPHSHQPGCISITACCYDSDAFD
jgi:hypothetical protein